MKTLKLLALAMLTFCIASCGNKNSVTLKIEPQLGELGQYISITEEEIVVKLDDQGKYVVASIPIQVNENFAAKYGVDLEVIVLDKNGVEISDLPNIEIESNKNEYGDDFAYIYFKGLLRGQMKGLKPKDWQKIKEQGASIIVKNEDSNSYKNEETSSGNDSQLMDENESLSSDIGDEGESDSNVSSGSNDWDAVLTSYEQYVDKYVSYAKKAMNGDMEALSEYPSLMQKAQELSTKLAGAKDEMSASQISRYMSITAKLTKMLSELQ